MYTNITGMSEVGREKMKKYIRRGSGQKRGSIG